MMVAAQESCLGRLRVGRLHRWGGRRSPGAVFVDVDCGRSARSNFGVLPPPLGGGSPKFGGRCEMRVGFPRLSRSSTVPTAW